MDREISIGRRLRRKRLGIPIKKTKMKSQSEKIKALNKKTRKAKKKMKELKR